MPSATTDTRAEAARRRRRRILLIALALVVVIGVAAVLYSAVTTSQRPGPAPAENAAPAVLTAHTWDGGAVTVPGIRPSVLLFFSVECGSCGPTAQAMAQAQQTGGQTANFIAVDIAGYETDAAVKGFLTTNTATALAYAIDTDAQWVRSYQVSQISTVMVLDDAGKEVFRAVEPGAEKITTELAKVTAG